MKVQVPLNGPPPTINRARSGGWIVAFVLIVTLGALFFSWSYSKKLESEQANQPKSPANPKAKMGDEDKPKASATFVRNGQTIDPSQAYVPEIVDAPHIEGNGYVRYLTGAVRNSGTREWKMVILKFKLLNSNGEIVGSTIDIGYNINPGEVWRHRYPIFDDSVAGFKFESAQAQ